MCGAIVQKPPPRIELISRNLSLKSSDMWPHPFMFQYAQNRAKTLCPSRNSASFLSLIVRNGPLLLQTVAGCTQPVRFPSAIVRSCPKLPPTPSRSPHPQFHLQAGVLSAICIHHTRQCQPLISTARLWRNLPLNHRPQRPPFSVLFCLKLKPHCARERPTSKCGKGSPTPASISPAKPFADSFAGHAKKRAYPRRRAGKVPKSPNLTRNRLRPA